MSATENTESDNHQKTNDEEGKCAWLRSRTVTLVTVTEPFVVELEIKLPCESCKMMLSRFRKLVPTLLASKLNSMSVPAPLAPGMAASRVSALKVIVPEELSIKPGRKKVAPEPGRKAPS